MIIERLGRQVHQSWLVVGLCAGIVMGTVLGVVMRVNYFGSAWWVVGCMVVLMVAYFYVKESRQTLLTFKAAANIWRQDRWKPLVAGAFNLTVNITLVVTLPDAYKLDGVILSTVLSFVLIQIPWESRIVFSTFFDRRQGAIYWRVQAISLIKAVLLCVSAWGVARMVPLSGVPGFIAKGAATGAFVACATCALFRREVSDLLSRFLRRQASRERNGK